MTIETKEKITTKPFDIAEHLTTPEIMAGYLTECLEEDDLNVFLGALDDACRAKGMTDVARLTGLGRESLYKTLSKGTEPRFSTIKKIITALDLKLTVSV